MTVPTIKRVRKKNSKRRSAKPKQRKKRSATGSDKGLLKRLAAAGATNEQMAAALNTSERTFYRLMQHDPGLYKVITEEKKKADANVMMSLYTRAMGMEVEEIVEEPMLVMKRQKDGQEEKILIDPTMVVTKRTRILIPPESKAAMMWLTNRDPENWKLRQLVGNDPQNPLPNGALTNVVMMPAFKQ